MPEATDPAAIEDAARALLETRMTSVRTLVTARQQREDARAAFDAAERTVTAAHTAALRSGWAEDELKRLGLDGPRRGPGRPRSTAPRQSVVKVPDAGAAAAALGGVPVDLSNGSPAEINPFAAARDNPSPPLAPTN